MASAKCHDFFINRLSKVRVSRDVIHRPRIMKSGRKIQRTMSFNIDPPSLFHDPRRFSFWLKEM